MGKYIPTEANIKVVMELQIAFCSLVVNFTFEVIKSPSPSKESGKMSGVQVSKY